RNVTGVQTCALPISTWQAGVQDGSLEAEGSFIDWQGENTAFSSVKVSNTTGDMMLRWFNIKNEETQLQVQKPSNATAYQSNVINENLKTLTSKEEDTQVRVPINEHEIMTIDVER